MTLTMRDQWAAAEIRREDSKSGSRYVVAACGAEAEMTFSRAFGARNRNRSGGTKTFMQGLKHCLLASCKAASVQLRFLVWRRFIDGFGC